MKVSHLLRPAAHRLRRLEINYPLFSESELEITWNSDVRTAAIYHAECLCELLRPILEAVSVVRGSCEASIDILRLGPFAVNGNWYHSRSLEVQEYESREREVRTILKELLTSCQSSRR